MAFFLTRRGASLAMLASSVAPFSAVAQTAEVWSADMAADALQQDLIRMIDVRSRPEWTDTGVADGTWPISLHEDRFAERLFAAREPKGGLSRSSVRQAGGLAASCEVFGRLATAAFLTYPKACSVLPPDRAGSRAVIRSSVSIWLWRRCQRN